MIAPARNISLAVIGCQGLDVLHMMRLKVACSLLMADYIQADVQEWKKQSVDVLVASIDDSRGQETLREADENGMSVLAVTRNEPATLSIPGVAYGASVREIFQQLRQLLVDSDASDGKFKPRTLFRSIEDAAGKTCLLNMGLVKVLVNSKRTRIAALRDLPYEKCLQAATESGWTLSVLSADAVAKEYLIDATSEYSYEDFCWQAAVLSESVLVPVSADRRYGLKGWPEVETGKLPANWLAVMAALLLREWKPAELAQTMGASMEDVLRILAAAKCTGLLQMSTADVVKERSKGAGVTKMFSRIAHRFGLYFGKKGQG